MEVVVPEGIRLSEKGHSLLLHHQPQQRDSYSRTDMDEGAVLRSHDIEANLAEMLPEDGTSFLDETQTSDGGGIEGYTEERKWDC